MDYESTYQIDKLSHRSGGEIPYYHEESEISDMSAALWKHQDEVHNYPDHFIEQMMKDHSFANDYYTVPYPEYDISVKPG